MTTERERRDRFAQVFADCYGPVLAFARRRVEQALAQDVAAEAFVTAWKHVDELPPNPLPWLYRVASNAIANQRRSSARRRRLHERVTRLASPASTPDHAEAVAETERIAGAFAQLREADRETLRLVVWDGLDHQAAASVAGCSVSAFKVRLHRARARLARLLASSEGDFVDPAAPHLVPWREAPL